MIPAVVPILLLLAALTPVDEAGYQKLVSANKGKVVLYEFWATWCTSCRAEMPKLIQLQARLKDRGFNLVQISADEPEQTAAAEKFIKQNGGQGPGYIRQARKEEDFINAIDPKWSGALPALFLYDRRGRMVRSFIGETDIRTIEAEIRKLL